MNSTCTNRNRTSEKWIELCKQKRNRSHKCRNRTYQSNCTKINRKKVSGETCYRKCFKSESEGPASGTVNMHARFARESAGRFGKMAERFSRPLDALKCCLQITSQTQSEEWLVLLEIFHLTLQMKVGALVAVDLALGLLKLTPNTTFMIGFAFQCVKWG